MDFIIGLLIVFVLIMLLRGGSSGSRKKTKLEIERLQNEKNDPDKQADALAKWKKLYKDGDITQEEYEKKKHEILNT
jgi:uncharacterized membrane protein